MLGARGKEVAYAVVSFGGVLSLGKKLFAIPWSALDVDSPKNKVVLNLDRETISTARGFEKGHGPDSQDWKADAQSPAPERAAVLEDPGPRAEAQGPGATPLGKPAATVGAVPAQDRMEQWGKTWKSHGLERS